MEAAVHYITPPQGSPCEPGEMVQVMFRPYDPPIDKGVVIGPWKSQIRQMKPFAPMDVMDFHRHKVEVIEPLIDRCPPIMACHPDSTDQVFGWVCGENRKRQVAITAVKTPEDHILPDLDQILHFVYVRGAFRRFGFGNALMRLCFPSLGRAPLYFTHRTAAMKHFVDRWNGRWDPYRAT